ncbi:MAG: DUF5655 domain-containing protein [Phenylobacterium sp.]
MDAQILSEAEAAEALFTDPASRAVYRELVAAALALGPIAIETKKTCVHLARSSAFAGAHPRKGAILVTLKMDRALETPRARKLEQASKHRWHCDLLLGSPDEIDQEFRGWLRDAYQLAG